MRAVAMWVRSIVGVSRSKRRFNDAALYNNSRHVRELFLVATTLRIPPLRPMFATTPQMPPRAGEYGVFHRIKRKAPQGSSSNLSLRAWHYGRNGDR